MTSYCMALITDTGISVFGIEVKQTDCTLQFNKYVSKKSCILKGRIDNASVAFVKSVAILMWLHSRYLRDFQNNYLKMTLRVMTDTIMS